MQLDELKETIQEFFQENTVTIVGSGLSSAEDIPGMGGLSKFLIAEVPGKIHEQSDIETWSKISAELATGKGLEAVLLDNAPTDNLEVAIVLTPSMGQCSETKRFRSSTLKIHHQRCKQAGRAPTGAEICCQSLQAPYQRWQLLSACF